jgi:uncharacterized protein (TIGR03437 family)
LAAGTYNGTITITSAGASNSPLTVSVQLTVNDASKITVSPSQLSFSYLLGGAAPASQTISVTSGQALSISVSVTGGAWLTVTPPSGTTPATLTAAVNPINLAANTYNATVTISAPGASNTPQVVNVTLTVSSTPTMSASPSSLSFMARTGGGAPAAQTINLTGTSAFSFTASATGGTWLSVTPASGTTPASLSVAVNPAGLGAGSYSASITVTAASASNSPLNIGVTLTISATQSGPAISGVFDAAGFDPDPFAPGSIVAIFGIRLGPDFGVPFLLNSDGKLDSNLAGVRVLVDGVPATPLFVYKYQINAILPFTMNASGQAVIQVEYNGVSSPGFSIRQSPSAIGIFTANATGKGPGAILNQDGSLNTAANPADKGSVIALYADGGGMVDPPMNAGDVAGTHLSTLTLPVSATINGADVQVPYAGIAPGLVVGVNQINVRLPPDIPSGSQPIMVTVGSSRSHSNVTVFVK